MFLVVASHSMDDIPLALFPHREDRGSIQGADSFALSLTEEQISPICGPLESPLTDYWGTDASTPICVCVIEFGSALDGNPGKLIAVKKDVVKQFDEGVSFVPDNCPLLTDGRDPLNTPELGGEA